MCGGKFRYSFIFPLTITCVRQHYGFVLDRHIENENREEGRKERDIPRKQCIMRMLKKAQRVVVPMLQRCTLAVE